MTEEELVEKVAASDAAFDGRGEWKALGRVDRERYAARARAALAAILETHAIVPIDHAEKIKAVEDRIARTRERIEAGAHPVGLKRFKL